MKRLIIILAIVFGLSCPASALTLFTTDLTEVIDKDDTAVSAQDYSATADVVLGNGYRKQIELVEIDVYMSELGTGDIQTPAGTFYIFVSDPNTTSGDTALAAAAAEHKVSVVADVNSDDWRYDANGATATISCSLFFNRVKTLYVVFRPDAGETEINSAAGDDEEMHIRLKYIEYK